MGEGAPGQAQRECGRSGAQGSGAQACGAPERETEQHWPCCPQGPGPGAGSVPPSCTCDGRSSLATTTGDRRGRRSQARVELA
ncbi:hypothetical protein CB1_000357025 [Camelus ferus]|nr:hypothetical protein CB1_000357025 [Camelus ferus]